MTITTGVGQTSEPADEPVLEIRGLSVVFRTAQGEVEAVRGVDLAVRAGETVAVVGESGSGKSTVAACVNRLLAENGRIATGSIRLKELDLSSASERTMTAVRGARIGFVPQDPMTNLDPVLRVGAQIVEALEVHGRARGAAARAEAVRLLQSAGIGDADRRFDQYPHEFSGGMRQRVLIAMALTCRPEVLIADEPTSALDVTVQRLVLDQMGELASKVGAAVLLITHDLALAAERADRLIVLHRGAVVEQGPAAEVIARPQHEYTRRLLAAAPGMTGPRVETVATAQDEVPLLEVVDVTKRYRVRGGDAITAVDGVGIAVPRARTVAIVGESGSGKSTTARLALKLEAPDSGTVRFHGDDATRLRGGALRAFRRGVQPVFQNPYASLDPRYTVAQAVAEPLIVHHVGTAQSRHARVQQLLDQVALPQAFMDRHPHELSGGQRQRVAIARAIALSPDLVVMDEAVSALDVLVQAQILELMVSLQRELDLSFLFISHDLAVVRQVAHVVHVMRAGRIVESGPPERLFRDPQHEYTKQLIAAIPGRGLGSSVETGPGA